MRHVLTAAGSAALLAALAPAAQAAEPLKFSGSVRGRYEIIEDTARAVPLPDEQVLNLRSILTAEYDAGALRFVGELWDSRVYGAETGSVISANEVNVFEPVQAYVAADFAAFGGAHTSLKAGRFVMDVGSRRLVANDDYRNTTNGFTGLKLDGAWSKDATFTAFYTAAQARLPSNAASVLDNDFELDDESGDLTLWGAAVARPTPWSRTTIDATFLRLDERDAAGRSTRDRKLSTLSARLIRTPSPGRFDVEVEGAWQTGQISAGTAANAASLEVAAGFLVTRAAYQFTDPWKTRLAVEYEWVSGDDGAPEYGRFDTLFGSRNGDFGPSGVYATVGRANISSPAIRLEVTPSKRLDGMATVRPMWLDSPTDSFSTSGVRDPTGASGRYAGTQVHARARYWVVPDTLRFEGHALWLAKGRLLKTAPNAGASKADTKYVSFNLTWSF